MAKLKSTLLNMFLSLTIICIVAAAILAYVDQETAPLIANGKKQKLENAIRDVIPGFDNSPLEDMYSIATSKGDSLKVYPAKKGTELLGVAIESFTMKGFSGEIRILVGLKPEGEIIDYAILQHAETPGLGDKMDTWFKTDKKNQNIIGRNLSGSTLKLNKDGGDVDAITAATITSRAFLDAVNRAYATYTNQEWDSSSGATTSSGEATDSTSGATDTSDSVTDSTSGATEASTENTDANSGATK
ncbi:RnfABCDGE type electron transport complex subunit G [Dysgonomonas sp. 216]|uniref:RnfABCDGE type electron transport complex subunit G n=1 Tax=Dysgonomonas sp. 216 TaxID=2302934 RepID=UPI0013D6D4F2|nr:RnfABCDGE type electron transport complex subunit G [Dysgonomonas sp. 216]NDW17517.1 RnfABCDGE type electron transport complex subunit G [Dysgonomonas sp. 216]